jgi:hypothetical protein
VVTWGALRTTISHASDRSDYKCNHRCLKFCCFAKKFLAGFRYQITEWTQSKGDNVKHLILASLILLGTQAHAIGADRFRCNVELTAAGAEVSTKQTQEINVTRLPSTQTPLPNTRMTTAWSSNNLNLIVSAKDEFSLNATIAIHYEHAVRLDANGIAIEARQMNCSGIGGGYCKDGFCSSSMVGCSYSSDPFDPVRGWTPTELSNGTPVYSPRDLAPVKQSITDQHGNILGEIKADCQFLGTFQ